MRWSPLWLHYFLGRKLGTLDTWATGMKEEFIFWSTRGSRFAGFCGHSCSTGKDIRMLVTLFGSKLHKSWQDTRNGPGCIWTNDLEMGSIISYVKNLSEPWKYSPTFWELTKATWYCGPKRVQFCSWPNTSSALLQCFNSALPHPARSSQIWRFLQDLLLSKFDQCCFAFVLACESPDAHPAWDDHDPDFSGSCFLSQTVPAGLVPQPVLCPLSSGSTETLTGVSGCACNCRGTLLSGCCGGAVDWFCAAPGAKEGTFIPREARETSLCSEEKEKRKWSFLEIPQKLQELVRGGGFEMIHTQ